MKAIMKFHFRKYNCQQPWAISINSVVWPDKAGEYCCCLPDPWDFYIKYLFMTSERNKCLIANILVYWLLCQHLHINTLRPRQNGCHFPDDIFKWIFLNENVWISIKITLKFVPRGPISNNPPLVQIMAWRRPGKKPLSEPMTVSLLTHICVTRPQWVKSKINIWQCYADSRCHICNLSSQSVSRFIDMTCIGYICAVWK